MFAMGCPVFADSVALDGAWHAPSAEGGEGGGAEVSPYKWYIRAFAGAGGAQHLPADDGAPHAITTFEIAAHPLGQVLSTGTSVSYARDAHEQWDVWSLGIFAQIDVTALLMSGLLAYPYDVRRAFFRLDLGERLGLAASRSLRPGNDVGDVRPYVLIRPELTTFVDFAVPIRRERDWFFLARAAFDTSVNLESLFRATATLGIEYSWGVGAR